MGCPWQNGEAGIQLSNTTTTDEEEDGMDSGQRTSTEVKILKLS